MSIVEEEGEPIPSNSNSSNKDNSIEIPSNKDNKSSNNSEAVRDDRALYAVVSSVLLR